MTLVGNGELAVAQSVPELDCTIPRARYDLAIVRGEGDGEDVVGVADEAARRHTRSKLPQTECFVPRGGESIGTVRGDDLEEQCISKRIRSHGYRAGIRSRRRCGSGHVSFVLGSHSAHRHG